MRQELERRPAVLGLAGLCIGLTALAFPLNLAFVFLGIVWMRTAAARLALSGAFFVGALLAPAPAAQWTAPRLVRDRLTAISVPSRQPGGESTFLARGSGGRFFVRSVDPAPVLGQEFDFDGPGRPIPPQSSLRALDRNVVATLRIGPGQGRARLLPPPVGIAAAGDAWRTSFEAFAARRLAKADRALVAALVFDDVSGLDPDQQAQLRQSGVIHVVVSSGLHLVALAWLIELVLARAPVPLIPRRALALVVVLLFAAATGFRPGAFRALFALGARDAAIFARREYDSLSALGLGLGTYLLWRPEMVYDPGFQLAAAVGGSLAAAGLGSGGERGASRLARAGLIGWLASVPLGAYLFGIVSLVSPIANLLALALLPFCFLGLLAAYAASFVSVEFGSALLGPAMLAGDGLRAVVDGFGGAPWWGFGVPPFDGYWLVPIYAAGAALLRVRRRGAE